MLSAPNKTDKIAMETGEMQNRFYAWVIEVTNLLNNLEPLVGSGTPEGSVVASVGRWFVDQDTVGTGIYLKETGTGDTGWVKRS